MVYASLATVLGIARKVDIWCVTIARMKFNNICALVVLLLVINVVGSSYEVAQIWKAVKKKLVGLNILRK